MMQNDQIKAFQQTQTKYPAFEWRGEWIEFAETITDIDEKVMFYRGLVQYGLNDTEPILNADAMAYFNAEVRPELNRQHQRHNRKKQRK